MPGLKPPWIVLIDAECRDLDKLVRQPTTGAKDNPLNSRADRPGGL